MLADALAQARENSAVPPDLLDRIAAVIRRRRRRRWAALAGVAVVAAGAVAVGQARAYHGPSLPALSTLPSPASGVLAWAPRGGASGDGKLVGAAVRRLASWRGQDRPTAHLHLIYAGDGITVLAGRTASSRSAVAEVIDGTVLTSRLTERSPAALVLPVPGGLRFLVAPYPAAAEAPTVFVQDPTGDSGGFRTLATAATGLTEAFAALGGDARFAVVLREPGPSKPVERVLGDGVASPKALVPLPARIHYGASPWRGDSSQTPSTAWLADAPVLAARVPPGAPVTVATLFAGGGVASASSPTSTYFPSLYAVRSGGRDYVGFVVRTADRLIFAHLSPLARGFAVAAVVGDHCRLPGASSVLLIVSRSDVTSADIQIAAGGGRPATRFFTGGPLLALDVQTGPVTITAYGRNGQRLGSYRIPGQ